MADKNATVTIEIVGDDIKFKKTLQTNEELAKKTGDKIGSGLEDSFSGIKNAASSLALPIAGIAAGFLAVRGAIESAAEKFKLAEEINLVNKQFDVLASKAGLIGPIFKDELKNATNGLIDTEDLLKSANKALIQFENGAEKIPELFSLATKASKVFGGTVTDNFESISQAIARGSTRQLANLGIIVKADDVYKAYAKSVGVAVDGLTAAEKQQALMNAVLQKGDAAFAGLKPNVDTVGFAYKQLSVALEESAQASALSFNKIFGPIAVALINDTTAALKEFNNELLRNTGTSAQKASAEIELLDSSVSKLSKSIDTISTGEDVLFVEDAKVLVKQQEDRLRFLQSLEDETRRKLNAQDQQKKQEAPVELTDEQKTAREKFRVEREQKELESQRKILGYEQQGAADRLKVATDTQTAKEILDTQADLIEQDRLLKRQELENNIAKDKLNGVITNKEQELAALDAIDADSTAKKEALRFNEEQAFKDSEQRKLAAAQGFSDGFVISAQNASAQAARAAQNGAGIGIVAFNSLKNRTVDAFIAMGSGAVTAGQAIKAAMFGTIADTAEAKGKEMLLAGIYPPNPAAIAGGAGLLALSGYLRSQGGASSSAIPGGAGASSGGVSDLGGVGTTAQETVQNKPVTSIAVNIQGNILDRRQTGLEIAEVLNETFGTTDMKIAGIA